MREGLVKITAEVCNYFTNKFTSSNPSHDSIDDILSDLEPKVTEDMSQMIDKAFMEEEIGLALFQMHPYKALGPDGLNAEFFSKILAYHR